MLAELPWGFVVVAARAGAVYHVVGSSALALAGHMGRAISLQVHVTRQDQLDSAVNATGALWQFGLGLVSNLCYCLTPCGASWRVYMVGEGVAFPRVLCYNFAGHGVHSLWLCGLGMLMLGG
jgi:hypothetical protein